MQKYRTAKKPLIGALAALTLACATAQAAAAPVASQWDDKEQVSVRLIAATDGLGPMGTVRAGIEFRLQPGWKVYWRSPGDAGYPPQPDFAGSENASMGPLAWPAPHRFSVLGLETLGYKDAVVLPFTVTASDPGLPATLMAHVNFLTCEEICIPYETQLTMQVPPGGGALTPLAHTINKFDSQVPKPGKAAHLEVTSLDVAADGEKLTLIAKATSALPLERPDVFVEGPPTLGYGKPATTLSDDAKAATFRVAVSGFKGTPAEAARELAGTPVTLTVVDGMRASETRLTVTAPDATAVAPPSEAAPSFALIMAFAFLGGLILNLMPCVLPVLSIKLMGAIRLGGGHPRDIRLGFLASAGGIVFAFAVLAGSLIALKAAGAGIGWGIQFQQPWFLILMSFAVTLFAANMWGLFHFRLPGAVADAAVSAGGHGGHWGHFLQGAFATLLATPCSAPFLGTAVGFALSRGPAEISAVFLMLGLGLAAPYLLVAAVPRLATLLPKPGPWMNKLRFVLGLALIGTAAWLLFVLMGVAGKGVAIVTLGVLVAALVWMTLRRSMPGLPAGFSMMFGAIALSMPLYSAYGPSLVPKAPKDAARTETTDKIDWRPFDPARAKALAAEGKLVFVDVTADWCITCAVNKRLVVESARIRNILNDPNVIAMQGDWTRPDPAIADYLASFGRYGIPFNAVYGAKAPNGVPLPELLSEENVLAGFRAAAPETLASRFE